MYRMISSPLNVVLYLNPTACLINFSKNNLEHWCIKIPPFLNYCQLIYCLIFLVPLFIIESVTHVHNYFTLFVYENNNMQCSLPIFSQAFKEERGRKVCKLSLSCLMNGWVVNDMHQTSVTLRLCLQVVQLYQIAFALTQKLYQTGFLVTHNNGDFDTISVTEQSCKVESHVSDRCSHQCTGYLFMSTWKGVQYSVNITLANSQPNGQLD